MSNQEYRRRTLPLWSAIVLIAVVVVILICTIIGAIQIHQQFSNSSTEDEATFALTEGETDPTAESATDPGTDPTAALPALPFA